MHPFQPWLVVLRGETLWRSWPNVMVMFLFFFRVCFVFPSTPELSSRVSNTIPRTSCGKRSMKFVKLYKDPKFGFGMVITCGNTCDTVLQGAFVESVRPGSPADLDGNINPGDQIMSVNGIDVQNDHFLTVVDLLQGTANSVDLVIAKGNKIPSDFTNIIKKEISEKPFVQTKTWIVGNETSKHTMPSLETTEVKTNGKDLPIPLPRKKWMDQEKSLRLSGPDLTLNHSSVTNPEKKKETNSNNISRDNIPDIIASQMKHLGTSLSDVLKNERFEDCEYLPITKNVDENFLLPGEIFHVVLDKKGGSLGLNIYQGTESTCSEQRHIYIHSVIPNGAADLDGRIKPGDKLLEVDGELLENLSYQEVVTKLRETSQVAHLVLEKGNLIESPLVENEIESKNNCQYSKNGYLSNVIKHDPNNSILQNSTLNNIFKYPEGVFQKETDIKRKESSASAEASFDLYKENESNDQSYSSLPTITNDHEFHSAKDTISELHVNYTPKRNFHNPSSPTYAKVMNLNSSVCRFQSPLTSYNSTPNLAENSDEEDRNEMNGGPLYRNRSTDCLATPLFLKPHQAVLDFCQNYSYVRGSASNLHQMPAVPIRKKKLKKLEDIYNYCNSDNTFQVVIQKSSRGLGLSISGGVEAFNRDPFSQLIRIRKLYPLQPALECGKLALGDVILEVNGTKMVGLTNTEALEVLRCAPTEVVLKVFRPSKSLIPAFSTFKGGIWPFFDSSSSSASSSLSRTEANSYNFETGEFEVTLVKRGGSLGFTISKIDGPPVNPEEGIYVKALVREPAVSDGRIQPGDRILKVNGTPVSSMSHAEAIEFMRNTPNSVTLTLSRIEPPLTPGYMDAEYSRSKPLRWEAVGLINDRLKQKKNCEENGTPTRKIKRKLGRISNAPSNSSTESESTHSSSSQEHVIAESVEPNDSIEDLNLEGAGLQRNQRPKSLDMLNSSDRKRCPAFTDEESFHRQSSVMCSNADSKNKNEEHENASSSEKAGKNLLKWRGSTLPHTDETDKPDISLDKCSTSIISLENETSIESTSDDEKPIPFPRTTSCSNYWVHTFDVELDRGWHGRLGFSLCDPPPDSPDSPKNILPKAAEVKAVYPGSLADKDGRIKVGDRLIHILNRECLLNKSAPEVIEILRRTGGLIKMVFCRLEKRT
ncbi:tyrosine-protein phosphatase non-receptor type 13 [Trichonephila clavata]|uniref:Tyrosine-protein phosphatase non-receptor type 13 n=1 Tax=Trichonephila clavata TaxID=2740835 RepID=A0A8X6IS99_TRICU|nr:tyrosine-protein phosphatase non-receptor type 13 [Trichonephila clavata]